MKETDLGQKVVQWLQEQHWDVYQEVSMLGSVADIVATQGHLVWIIECKLSLSLQLIAQANEWLKMAHFVTVAIPDNGVGRRSGSKARYFAHQILQERGIGLIVFGENQYSKSHIIRPRINRKVFADRVRKSLCENQKTWAMAGSKGGYWTPFQETSRKVVNVVSHNPGIKLKDLISKVDHHYASDKSATACISHWAQSGVIKGIRCEQDGRFLRFYPESR